MRSSFAPPDSPFITCSVSSFLCSSRLQFPHLFASFSIFHSIQFTFLLFSPQLPSLYILLRLATLLSLFLSPVPYSYPLASVLFSKSPVCPSSPIIPGLCILVSSTFSSPCLLFFLSSFACLPRVRYLLTSSSSSYIRLFLSFLFPCVLLFVSSSCLSSFFLSFSFLSLCVRLIVYLFASFSCFFVSPSRPAPFSCTPLSPSLCSHYVYLLSTTFSCPVFSLTRHDSQGFNLPCLPSFELPRPSFPP